MAQVSEFNDRTYRSFLSPWVRACSSDLSAEMMRWLNPLSAQRYMISDMNPALRHLGAAAAQVRAARKPAAQGNAFAAREKALSSFVEEWFNFYRDSRTAAQESPFRAIYGRQALQYSSIAAGTFRPWPKIRTWRFPGRTTSSGSSRSGSTAPTRAVWPRGSSGP